MSGQPAAGWYDDPSQPGRQRWWDGAAWHDSASPAATAAPSGLPTWEYRVDVMNMSDRWTSKGQAREVAAFAASLTQLGQQGWEMISYESVPLTGAFTDKIKGYAYLVFLKRRTS